MRMLHLAELQAVAGGAEQRGPTVAESAAVGGGIGGAVGASVVAEAAGGWGAVAGGAALPSTAGTTLTLFSTAGAGLAVEGWTAYQFGSLLYDHLPTDTQMGLGEQIANGIDGLVDNLVSGISGLFDRGNFDQVSAYSSGFEGGANDGPWSCGMLKKD